MEISVKTFELAQHKTPCVVVGVFDNHHLSDAAELLDQASHGYLARILKRGDFKGAAGDCLVLHDVPGLAAERVLLAGCGKKDELDVRRFRQMITAVSKTIKAANIKSAVVASCDLPVADTSVAMLARHATEAVHHALYSFDELKSSNNKPSVFNKITLHLADKKAVSKASDAVKVGNAIAAGAELARHLGNLPGNICTPTYLANEAKKLAKGSTKLKVTVLNQKELEKLGMGSFLAVARGSRQPPKFIVMEYKGGKADDKPYVLVGKGITFDSGGISIKPGAAMDEMKFDMCGAASVIGTMNTVKALQLPINVVGVVPSCENLPDGDATKPGDVLTSMSGQTIEVLNTDAEGRLILCDALTYSEKFHPKAVIDVATLTGACVIALGKHPAGLLSNHQPLADQILAAGLTSQDRAWQLPLWDEYQDQLKTNFADMANIGGREAGTITAACFLSRFAKKYHWAHLDIAGVAWESGAAKGATGRPVPLLTQYLLDRCGKKFQLS